MIEAQESVTGTITGTISINAVVNNGTVIPEEIDPTVPSHVKAITQEDISKWNNKAEATHTHNEYLTSIPSEYVTETELKNKNYLVQDDIKEFATKEELNTKAEATHTHSQYLTEVPSEYVTENELNSKGYATKEELKDIDVDLTDYYTKTEIDNKGYLTQEDIGDIDVDINSISDETIKDIVNIQITNANEVSY